jgi:hypothetical protein
MCIEKEAHASLPPGFNLVLGQRIEE